MDRLKLLLLGLILLGCIIVPLATKAAVRDLTDRQVAMLLPPLWLAPALPGAPRSHLGDIEAPYRADGIATVDFDLDTGGYQLILDDGATGAGNLSFFFGQDTDLGCFRSGANIMACEGNLTLTGYLDLGASGNLTFGAATEQLLVSSALMVAEARHGVNVRLSADEAVAARGPLWVGSTNASNELTASSGRQFGIKLGQAIRQTGTASMAALLLEVTDNTSGSGQDYLAYWDWNADSVPEFTMTDAGVAGFADYTRHHDVPIGAAIVGATAPTVETIGTFRCLVFDANADLAHISVEVPSEWNGSSDMAIDLLVFTDQGDALGSGEVIEFDLVYRSVAVGEAYDNGTAVTILANVTGGASEVDKGQYKITATVDYDDTDQPLAVNDTLGFSIMRDVTTGDTYSGDVHVCRAQLVYTANALATH